MTSLAPRLVLVTRRTEFERLLATHATRGQAEFFLKSQGQSLDALETRHEHERVAIEAVKRAVPAEWSLAEVLRDDLDRFLFASGDVVVAVGQDGLVANLAKYLDGQAVVGVTPDAERTEGVLTPLCPEALPRLLPRIPDGAVGLQRRAMVEARLPDGQTLTELNELFIGHRSHQSARYMLRYREAEEMQSSSGVIVSTGTGLSGWARSILTATHREVSFAAEDRRAVYFAREPWPSRVSGCALSFGEISDGEEIQLTSRMNDGGVIFADGVEQDFLQFDWGKQARVALSAKTLKLVALGSP